MDITIAVVTYNAAEYIKSCLESLLKQTPHNGQMEIIIVDGCSTDQTQVIVRSFGDRVRLALNPKRTIASNRKVAVCQASFPYIAFTDADCVAPHNWLLLLSQAFARIEQNDSRLAGVGGGNVLPSNANPFQVSLGIALDSFLGSLGSVQGKVFTKERPVSSLANLNVLYKKESLESIGGYDEQLANMCEDTDLNYRLGKAGWRLYFIPGAYVTHYASLDLSSWCAKMYRYGIGRARIIRKHCSFFAPGYLMALLFLPALIISGLVGMVWPWAFLAWLYFPFIFCAGFVLALKKKSLDGLRVGGVLLGTHISYALGLWRGFLL